MKLLWFPVILPLLAIPLCMSGGYSLLALICLLFKLASDCSTLHVRPSSGHVIVNILLLGSIF